MSILPTGELRKSVSQTEVEIVSVRPEFLPDVVALFARIVYAGDVAEANSHFADHEAGQGTTLLAVVQDELAGYVTIRWQSNNPLFAKENIPLIHHLEVFSEYRRRGIATRLMDEAEQLVSTRADRVGITVGLFDEYGPAQRLYAKRGYIPDARGACQGHRPLRKGETVTVSHDLILWLIKDLRSS
jgi:GNAT superfamily N-acetyltransferase